MGRTSKYMEENCEGDQNSSEAAEPWKNTLLSFQVSRPELSLCGFLTNLGGYLSQLLAKCY